MRCEFLTPFLSALLILALHGNGWSQQGEPSGNVRLIVQTGHAREIYGVAFSADGKRIMTGGHESLAILWDVQTGKELGIYTFEPGVIRSVALSRDGKRFLTADGSKD